MRKLWIRLTTLDKHTDYLVGHIILFTLFIVVVGLAIRAMFLA